MNGVSVMKLLSKFIYQLQAIALTVLYSTALLAFLFIAHIAIDFLLIYLKINQL